MAAKVRYGLQVGSADLNSTLFAAGLSKYIGIRHAADRFLADKASMVGASKPGVNLL